LKIDFKKNLNELYLIFDSLFFNINLPPFIENKFTLRKAIISGYEIKKNEHNLLLEESCEYLINYDKLSNKELFKKYFDSNGTIQELIFDVIKNRFSKEYIPNNLDIDYFNNFLNNNNDNQNLIKYFFSLNYFFDKINY